MSLFALWSYYVLTIIVVNTGMRLNNKTSMKTEHVRAQARFCELIVCPVNSAAKPVSDDINLNATIIHPPAT